MGQTAQNDFFTESYVWNDIIYDIAYVNCLGGVGVAIESCRKIQHLTLGDPVEKNSTLDPNDHSTLDPIGIVQDMTPRYRIYLFLQSRKKKLDLLKYRDHNPFVFSKRQKFK